MNNKIKWKNKFLFYNFERPFKVCPQNPEVLDEQLCFFYAIEYIYIYIFSQKCWKLTEIIVLKQVTSTGYNLVSKYIIIEKVVYSKWNTTSWNPWFSKFFVFSRIRDSKHTDTDRKKWIFCMWIFNQNKNSFKSNMYLKIVYICISLMKNW